MNRKRTITILTMSILAILMLSTNVMANVESRPNVTSLKGVSASNFFALIRKMESATGPMGLTATIDNAGKETSASNNIDVHMIKNTEWGTAAMLAASSYGSAPTGSSNGSITGNATGIYQMADGTWEYVAGMYNVSAFHNSNIYNADSKYWDKYTEKAFKPGDATLETAWWKGASSASFVGEGAPMFIRSYGGIFSFGSITADGRFTSRAAVVCGAGL